MWHDFLVIPPLLCFMVATWRLWEPEVDPRFGWILVGFGFQLLFLADKVLTGASLWSIGMAVIGVLAFIYVLKKTIALEQSTKRLRELREE